jgi:hypothetical protein
MVDEQTQASFSVACAIFLIYLLHWFHCTFTKKDLLASSYLSVRPFLFFMCMVENSVSVLLESAAQVKFQQFHIVSDLLLWLF